MKFNVYDINIFHENIEYTIGVFSCPKHVLYNNKNNAK